MAVEFAGSLSINLLCDILIGCTLRTVDLHVLRNPSDHQSRRLDQSVGRSGVVQVSREKSVFPDHDDAASSEGMQHFVSQLDSLLPGHLASAHSECLQCLCFPSKYGNEIEI